MRPRAQPEDQATSVTPQDDGTASPSEAEDRLSWSARLLVAMVTACGLGLVAGGWADLLAYEIRGWGTDDLGLLLALALLAIVAERLDFSLYGNSRASVAVVPIFGSLILFGLPGLAVVIPLAVLSSAIGTRRPLYKTAFNFGTLMLAGAASSLVFHGFGADAGAWPEVLGPVILAAGLNFAVNSVLVAAAIALSSRSAIRSVWTEHFFWLWPHYLLLGVLGLAFASAYEAMGLWGPAVFLAPPIMMRLSLKQYLDKTTQGVLDLRKAHGELQTAHGRLTSAMTNLDKAYDGTLRSLVAALDARDSETGGHSSRVADLTAAIAEEMGISRESEEGRIIATGALLHDVGKIAVPDAILRKPGKLTDEEWVTMRTHARAGFDIVESVDFLAPAAEIILAHHERWDGAGYPRGLAGEEVPLGARIFMIADTFDAITSVRPYKAAIPAEEALAEILRHSGTQFDPTAVQAFLSVYKKRFVGSAGPLSPKRQLSQSVRTAIAEATARMERTP